MKSSISRNLILTLLLTVAAQAQNTPAVRPFVDFNLLAASPARIIADPANGTFFIRVQEISVLNVSAAKFENARLIWSVTPAGARCEIGAMTFNNGVLDPRSFKPLNDNAGNSRVQELGSVRADSTRFLNIAVRYPAVSGGCSVQAALQGNLGGRGFASAARNWHLDK